MRALPARSNPIWRVDLRERYVMSLWFIPTCFTIGAIVLANLSIWLDERIDAPVAVRWLRALFDELEATCPDCIDAIGRQRELLDAAVAQSMPAAFAVVAGVSDREGLG